MLRKRTKGFLLRILALYSIFGMAVMPVTTSYFVDIETSTANSFTASSLDFSLVTPNPGSPVKEKLIDEEINYGERTHTAEVVVKKDGDLGFKYKISFEKTDGDDDLCDALKVDLEQDENDIYDGLLKDIDTVNIDLSGSSDEIDFEVYLDSDNKDLQGDACKFNLIFETTGNGFSDEESIITNEVRTGWWINPTVKVNIPNGGEKYTAGQSVDIKWDAESTDSSATAGMKIDIYLSTDSGTTYTKLIDDTENDGVWGWAVGSKSTTMRIKVTATDSHGLTGSDTSDADFDPEDPKDSDSTDEVILGESEDNPGDQPDIVIQEESLDQEEFTDE